MRTSTLLSIAVPCQKLYRQPLPQYLQTTGSKLAKRAGQRCASTHLVIELAFLQGARHIKGCHNNCLISYTAHTRTASRSDKGKVWGKGGRNEIQFKNMSTPTAEIVAGALFFDIGCSAGNSPATSAHATQTCMRCTHKAARSWRRSSDQSTHSAVRILSARWTVEPNSPQLHVITCVSVCLAVEDSGGSR